MYAGALQMDSCWRKEGGVMTMTLGYYQDLVAEHQKRRVIERMMCWDRAFVAEAATPHSAVLSAHSASFPVAEKMHQETHARQVYEVHQFASHVVREEVVVVCFESPKRKAKSVMGVQRLVMPA